MTRSGAKVFAELPSNEEVELARDSSAALSRLLASKPEAERAHVRFDDTDLVVPRHVIALLRDILSEMARGNAISLIPLHHELTTQQAADLLNVSRPYFVGLLERHEIAFTRTGTHRRVRFEDVMAYKQARDQRGQEAVDELSRQAQELDMGY